jgi:hypothetical protein
MVNGPVAVMAVIVAAANSGLSSVGAAGPGESQAAAVTPSSRMVAISVGRFIVRLLSWTVEGASSEDTHGGLAESMGSADPGARRGEGQDTVTAKTLSDRARASEGSPERSEGSAFQVPT